MVLQLICDGYTWRSSPSFRIHDHWIELSLFKSRLCTMPSEAVHLDELIDFWMMECQSSTTILFHQIMIKWVSHINVIELDVIWHIVRGYRSCAFVSSWQLSSDRLAGRIVHTIDVSLLFDSFGKCSLKSLIDTQRGFLSWHDHLDEHFLKEVQ